MNAAEQELADDLALMRSSGRYTDADIERYAATVRRSFSYGRASIGSTIMAMVAATIPKAIKRILSTPGAGR